MSYHCWVPPNQKKRICADLSLSIQVVTDRTGRVQFQFNVINSGSLVAMNTVLFVSILSGSISGTFPASWIVGPNFALLPIGNLSPGQTLLFGGNPPTLTPGASGASILAVVTSDTPDCNPSNNTATAHIP